MVTIKYFPCQLEDRCYELESPNHAIHTVLLHLIREYPEIKEDSANIAIRVNGKLISPFAWHCTTLEDGDRVFIIQEVGYGVDWIGYVLVAVGAIGAATPTTAAISTIVLVAYALASIAYTIYSACTKPDAQHAKGADSPTYGWDGIQTNMQQGGPVAVVYGEHNRGGHTGGGVF